MEGWTRIRESSKFRVSQFSMVRHESAPRTGHALRSVCIYTLYRHETVLQYCHNTVDCCILPNTGPTALFTCNCKAYAEGDVRPDRLTPDPEPRPEPERFVRGRDN